MAGGAERLQVSSRQAAFADAANPATPQVLPPSDAFTQLIMSAALAPPCVTVDPFHPIPKL